jgi:4-amino-4-deoxy-L-arabinose transferase-like glycosyltransferase
MLQAWLERAERRCDRGLRWLAWTPYAATAFLAVLCIALYLPGIASIPVTDRDEARFAQATKQMLETRDYVDIRFQDVPRYKKPVGIHWLQSVSVGVATRAGTALNEIWAYRIPSFLGALTSVLLLFSLARPVFGRRVALLASMLFAAAFTVAFEARIAKSDAALLATLVLTQGALLRLAVARTGRDTRVLAALFWAGLGLSILIKGPIGPAVAALTASGVALVDRRRGWLRGLHWRWGVPLMLAIAAPWFIAIGIASGGAFFKASLGQDFAQKLQSGQEAHWGPPGFYIALVAWTFWPAMLFVSKGTLAAIWRARRTRRMLVLLAWIVPFWLLIELTPTKLPHYGLPIYAGIALALTAVVFASPNMAGSKWRVGPLVWGAVALLQGAFLVVAVWLFEMPVSPWLVALLAGYAAASVLAVTAAWQARMQAVLAFAVLAACLVYTAAFRFVLPGSTAPWLSDRVYGALETMPACGSKPVAFAGYGEPSTVFMHGTRTLLSSAETAAEALARGEVRIAAVQWPWRERFETRFRETASQASRFLGCVDGVNLNGRGPTRLQLYASPSAPAACQPTAQTACSEKSGIRWRRLLDTKF